MEHLPLPQDPIQPHPTLVLASYDFSDPLPFADYPAQRHDLIAGQHPNVPTQKDALLHRSGGAGAASDADVLRYYQGWLFFSLLRDFLGPDVWVWENYMVSVRNGDGDDGDDGDGGIKSIHLSTATLHADLERWAAALPADFSRAHETYRRLGGYLDTVKQALEEMDVKFPMFSKIHFDDVLCFASLAEVLDTALVKAGTHAVFCRAGERGWLRSVGMWQFLAAGEGRTRMVKAGWCLSDIHRILDTFDSITSFYYFSNFKIDASGSKDHSACTHYICNVRGPAKPSHCEPDCDCPQVEFDPDQLTEIYRSGKLPCISIGRHEGSLAYALVSVGMDAESQKDPDNHYIALSHVWSDGMGNPFANALPLCRLAETQRWAMPVYDGIERRKRHEASRTSPVDKDHPGIKIIEHAPPRRQVNLWIDTMCCPAPPGPGKSLCLSRMREIYASAYAGLVKDSTLRAYYVEQNYREPETAGTIEPAARVFLSPWMRRMWTLQEAALAGLHHGRGAGDRLFVQFADGSLNLESVVQVLKSAPAREAAFAYDFIGKLGSLSSHVWQLGAGREQEETRFIFLHMLSYSLRYRALTVPTDESICIATLLGLNNTGKTISDDKSQGMREVWQQVADSKGGLPTCLIFTDIPRLDVPGFRWAPRTLIGTAEYGDFKVYPIKSDPARLTTLGLEVRLPGARFTTVPGKKRCLRPHQPCTEYSRSRARICLLRLPGGGGSLLRDEETTGMMKVRDAIRRPNMALVGPSSKGPGSGLLVEVMESNGTGMIVRTLATVSVIQFDEDTCLEAECMDRYLQDVEAAVAAKAEAVGLTLDDVWDDKGWKNANENDPASPPLFGNHELTHILREAAVKLLNGNETLRHLVSLGVLSRQASATDDEIVDSCLERIDRVAHCGIVHGTACPYEQVWCID